MVAGQGGRAGPGASLSLSRGGQPVTVVLAVCALVGERRKARERFDGLTETLSKAGF